MLGGGAGGGYSDKEARGSDARQRGGNCCHSETMAFTSLRCTYHTSVGLSVGLSVGDFVGLSVGDSVGISVGENVGGTGVGECVSRALVVNALYP